MQYTSTKEVDPFNKKKTKTLTKKIAYRKFWFCIGKQSQTIDTDGTNIRILQTLNMHPNIYIQNTI